MAFPIAVVVFVALTVLGMGSYVPAFIDVSAVLILLPAPFLAGAAVSFSALRDALVMLFGRPAFRPAAGVRPEAVEKARTSLRVLGTAGLWLGLTGLLTGAIIVLQHADTPARIGPGLALAMLSPLYGLVLKILCFAAELRIAARFSPTR